MNKPSITHLIGTASSILLLLTSATFAQNPYAGLWVGRAALSHVNEVTIPLDENNQPVAPDPNVPTLTHDQAYIRLILHVNAEGQVNLLKDVAILKESVTNLASTVTDSESDYVLVTDPRLYPEFPQQEAVRIASAVFDFGDSKATEAVDQLVSQVASNAATSVQSAHLTATANNTTLRAAEDAAQTAAENATTPLLAPMDVATTFAQFFTNIPPTKLTTLATTDPLDLTEIRAAAQRLRDHSFYRDERALNLVENLELVVNAASGPDAKKMAAHNLISRYVDVENKYQRFIAGRSFGNMIQEVAQVLGTAATQSGATPEHIRSAVNAAATVDQVRTEAINASVAAYEDSAATNAVEIVLDAMIADASTNALTIASVIASDAEAAGLLALEQDVPRYALQTQTPSADYTTFIQSSAFKDSVTTAARAAALDTVAEAIADPFHDATTLFNAAKIAAIDSLVSVYALAARAQQTEQPMQGHFSAGQGDPRLVSTLSNTDEPLGAAALTTTLYLPASHPTNPFRHRRHPDHTTGMNIQRNIRIDFEDSLERVSTGVNQISGVYREEIFGLHKPLGASPVTHPIGLKVEGQFELNRVSHIDTLNAL